MNIKLLTLTLNCRKSKEIIEFSPQVTFFHGKISAGKSSIARLIDFCLGGELERTPAILQELVSVGLLAIIGDNEVLFEREAKGTNVQVIWKNDEGETSTVLAPIKKESRPIWSDKVFNLSDLIFYLLGIEPIKVRRSKRQKDPTLVRLSFRDIMWYCYLQQDKLDSSFFRLEDAFRGYKSRDVMRFVVGYYTKRLNDLEVRLEEVRDQRHGKIMAVEQVREFLEQFGFGTESEIKSEIDQVNKKLNEAMVMQSGSRKNYMKETHFADKLRKELQELSDNIKNEEQTLVDLAEKIEEQETLKAELLTAKFKLARKETATKILSGVLFEDCPSCGETLKKQDTPEECRLCGNMPSDSIAGAQPQAEIVSHDLYSRISELDESIFRHKKAKEKQKRILEDLKERKGHLDEKLTKELESYDSNFLSNTREIERRVATLEERARSLEKLVKMPEAISKLLEEADGLLVEEEEIKREINSEKSKLGNADQIIGEIEEAFLETILAVGMPGVREDDKILINRNNWRVSVLPSGEEALKWDFYNAGSGGKKTLFNVCYALAVHKISAEHDLPLPKFLIIDSPMKNISEDVNRDIFSAFYENLYNLLESSLSDTQIIIIDQEYIRPSEGRIKINERFMTPDDPKNPPLIPYYRGP